MSEWIMPRRNKAPPSEEPRPEELQFNFVMPRRKPVEEVIPPEISTLQEEPWYKRSLIGFGSRVDDMGLGLKQAAGHVLGNEDMVSSAAAASRDKTKYRAALGDDTAAMLGGVGADIGVTLPLAGVGAAIKGVQGVSTLGKIAAAPIAGAGKMMAAPIMGSGVAGGLLGGPLTPQENESPGYMLESGLKGAGLGLAGGALTHGLLSAVGKGFNMAKGRFADPETAARIRAFDEWGVPGSLGDVSQKPLVMYGENLAQYAPFSGREAFLANQSHAIRKALTDAPERIAGPIASGTKEDLGKALTKSLKDQYKTVKQTAGKMYDDVESLVTARGAPPIVPSNLASTAKQLEKDYPSFFKSFQDSKAVSRLQDIIRDTGPQSSRILGPNGQPIQSSAAIPFSEMRWLDKRLGSMIRQADKQVFAGKMDPEAFQQFIQLQKALRSDIDSWAASSGIPEVASGVTAANKYFVENVLPFRNNSVVAKALKDRADLDRLPSQLLKLDSPALTQQVATFLTPEGRQAAKHFMVQQAEKRAMDEALNPMLGFLRRESDTVLGESGPKLFSPEELARLKSLEGVLGASKRAVRHASDPAESARMIGMLALTNPVLPAAARAFTATGQNNAMSRYLLADPSFTSPASGGLARMIEESARRAGAALGGGLHMTDHDLLSGEF